MHGETMKKKEVSFGKGDTVVRMDWEETMKVFSREILLRCRVRLH